MFELIHKKLKHTEAYPCLLSVLHHCLQMPCEYPVLAITLSKPRSWATRSMRACESDTVPSVFAFVRAGPGT